MQANMREDVSEVLLKGDAIQKRVREMGRQIAEDYTRLQPHLICILKGATIFHADLMRAIDLTVSVDFIAVASYGASTHSSGEVRILKDLDESIEGRDVVLLEDIVDTGLTLNYLVHNLQSRGPRSLKVATLLNKPVRRQVEVDLHYVGFEIPDKFVVGYGLDYAQRYRNLPDICALRLEPQLNGS